MDHIDQAIHSTVHNSAIPTKEIARRLDVNHQVLNNKASPSNKYHKLTLREAVDIQLITGNHRIFEAMQTELRIQSKKAPEVSLIDSVLNAVKEQGDVVKIIQESLADGRFTLRERERCQQEIDEAQKALNELRQSIVNH